MNESKILDDCIGMLRGMLSTAWQKPSDQMIERLLKRLEGSKPATCAASSAARESLVHLPTGVRADHHHSGLPQLRRQLPREPKASLEEDLAGDALCGKDLDDVGVLDLALPETEGLREGGPDELGARQSSQGTPESFVTDPFAGLIREVGSHVEPHGAGGAIGHTLTLHDLKQRGKYRSNHFYLYFEVDRSDGCGDGQVTVETSWLPNLRPVREQLAPLGFVRNERGAWRTRVAVDDLLGVSRRVTRALELLLVEASQLIDADD